ncbi:MAG: OmpA family protein [Dehalococcoidia bacterium]
MPGPTRRGMRAKQAEPAAGRAQRKAEQEDAREESQPDAAAALWRIKKDGAARSGPADFLALQRSLGNKGLAQVIRRYGGGGGLRADAVRALHDPGLIQRHSIPEGRQGTGEEDEEIGVQRFVQRQPAFGHPHPRPTRPGPWGNGSAPGVQRKNGKGGGGGKGGAGDAAKGGGAAVADPAAAKGGAGKVDAKEDEASKKVAEAEFGDYVKAGPYRINNYVPDTIDDFGKFDAIYDPAAKTLKADMRVKFTFPDAPVPEKADTLAERLDKAMIQATQILYIGNFISQVHAGWSGKFTFRNARAPQSIWAKLNPITVKVNVSAVDTNQHYTMKAWLKKGGGVNDIANVSSNSDATNPSQVELFKGDTDSSTQDFTGSKQTAPHEIKRLKRNLPKIHFAPGSAEVDPKYIPDLQYVSDYLRQMSAPKFNLAILGHASRTGKEPANVTISQARADAVAAKLKEFGVTNHNVTTKGMGSAGASAQGRWRKVSFSPTVDKGFKNIQDTTLHEFGHMLGLDDEYVRSGDKRKQTTQHTGQWMQKMLGDEAYGKGKENRLATEVTKVDKLQSASVMYSGNEVRSSHYVTLWQALYDTAAKGAKQPAAPFTFADWKVNG